MNGRRRKDEPFNPFAPNASQKARDRKDKSSRHPPKQRSQQPSKTTNDFASKQKAAIEQLKKRRDMEAQKLAESSAKPVIKPNHQLSPQPKPVPKTEIKRPDSREERLAALRAKSAATAQFAKDAKDAKKAVETEDEGLKVQIEIKPDPAPNVPDTVVMETEILNVKKESSSMNVFKTIKTDLRKGERKQKKRRSPDRRGGGRQPQSKKLDRRKYLEYKYAARELLDNDSISEEHRSNILGQIWAKGERSGIDNAIEFINQKEAELIIPENVAEEFRRMVKKYTTKR